MIRHVLRHWTREEELAAVTWQRAQQASPRNGKKATITLLMPLWRKPSTWLVVQPSGIISKLREMDVKTKIDWTSKRWHSEIKCVHSQLQLLRGTRMHWCATPATKRKKTKYQFNVLPLHSLRGGRPTRPDTTLPYKVASGGQYRVLGITVLVQSTTVLIVRLRLLALTVHYIVLVSTRYVINMDL